MIANVRDSKYTTCELQIYILPIDEFWRMAFQNIHKKHDTW